jgi:glycosyltransferase involved in cell wall biosynthesis
LPFLLDVVYLLKKTYPRIGLLIIGKGPLPNIIRSKITNYCLSKNVIFAGPKKQKELPAIYKAANIFLLPTNYEIFGMVVLEALFNGIPVISTPQAGPVDILSKPIHGQCIDLSVEDWGNAIKQYLPKNQKDSEARKEYVKSNYLWPLIAKRYAEMLNNLS